MLRDASQAVIEGGDFDRHLVARQDTDELHPHVAADVGLDLVAAFQPDPKTGVGQGGHDRGVQGVGFWLGDGWCIGSRRL